MKFPKIEFPNFSFSTPLTQWVGHFKACALGVFTIHLTALAIHGYLNYDMSLVVSGFDVGKWGFWGRLLSLIPYVIFPTCYASVKVAGWGLPDLLAKSKTKNKSE